MSYSWRARPLWGSVTVTHPLTPSLVSRVHRCAASAEGILLWPPLPRPPLPLEGKLGEGGMLRKGVLPANCFEGSGSLDISPDIHLHHYFN
jgi:hypothetical protein